MKLKTKLARKGLLSLPLGSLAVKLRQNWLAQNPVEDNSASPVSLDDSLTSLDWLQHLNMSDPAGLSQPARPVEDTGRQTPSVDPPQVTTPPPSPDYSTYQTNAHSKPPYSYTTLICMALREAPSKKLTLAGIYSWIIDHFMYYRVADPSWQNSIRHNLSLNKCFQKVPRRRDEPGKGNFWQVDPECENMFDNGIYKKRRCSPVEGLPPLKKIKVEKAESRTSAARSVPTPDQESTTAKGKPSEKVTAASLFKQMETDAVSSDFRWGTVLDQDIEVDGVRIKTEDLLNDTDPICNSLVTLSPPPSEHNTSVDASSRTPSPLDLTVTDSGFGDLESYMESLSDEGSSSQSSVVQKYEKTDSVGTATVDQNSSSHQWADDRSELEQALAFFDTEFNNMFGFV